MKYFFPKLMIAFALLINSAYAAVPAEVTTALDNAKTDALVIAAAVLIIIISLAAFKFMRRGVT